MKTTLLVSALFACSVFPVVSCPAAEVSSPPSPSGSLDEMSGPRTVDGTVTQVDPGKGEVQIKTTEGTIVLHFESPEIPDLRPGDTIRVRLTPKTNGPASDK